MADSSAAAARRNYNRLSRWYDSVSDSFEGRYRGLGLDRLAVRPGEAVLEIGPGTGHALVALARAVGPNGRVVGIDISEKMVAITRKRLDSEGLPGRVDLRHDDARRLPWPDGTFDAVFMSFVLEQFAPDDVPLVLAESHRVLKPGGRIGVVAMSSLGRNTLMMRLYRFAHWLAPRTIDCRPIDSAGILRQQGFNPTVMEVHNLWGLNVEILVAGR